MRTSRRYVVLNIILFAIVISIVSCTEYKDVPYFRDVADSAKYTEIVGTTYKDPVIRPDDILSISIVTLDPATTAPVNQAAGVTVTTSSTSLPAIVPGILVDKDGNISLPIIGSVMVAGLTTTEAKASIKKVAEHYFKEPDVQLRFANFTVTVLGEVEHPGTFLISNEKVSVLDAIGMAGDLTIYGRRDNVMVVRENKDKKELARLDLNSSDIFKSPYFYLQQNDAVYIEPNKQKAIAADASRTRLYTILASAAAVLIVLFTRVK